MCLFFNLFFARCLCWPFRKRDEKKWILIAQREKEQQLNQWRKTNGSQRAIEIEEQKQVNKRTCASKQYEDNLIHSSQDYDISDELLSLLYNKKQFGYIEKQKRDFGAQTKHSPYTFTHNDNEIKRPNELMAESKESQQASDPLELDQSKQTTRTNPSAIMQVSPSDQPDAPDYSIRGQFKIRTSNRRHVDFDPEYDLSDSNATNRSKWSGPFHFIQAADSQFGMIDSYVHKRTEPGWEEEIELCRQLIDTCNHMEPKPLFLIVCGDLVDAWPATEIRQRQVADFKRVFALLRPDIPLVCVCGNHDVGDQPTMPSVQEFNQTFGDDYYYFTKNDVLFIVINSQFYQHREFVQDYAKQQDQWLESMLAKCKLFKYSIVFEHIPWFLEHYDEEDDYFNIKKEVRLTWLRKFKDAGVTKIMCGHYHRNAGGWYEGLELIVTSAIGAQCGKDKSGARVVRVLDKSIEHQYYAMSDIPRRIQLH